MTIEALEAFQKDIKKLQKKYATLAGDIALVKKVILVHPQARPPFSYTLQTAQTVSAVIKVKKISSRSFKGRGVQSGFRLVYAYFEKEERIVLIELYHKSKQANEDRERIKAFFSERADWREGKEK